MFSSQPPLSFNFAIQRSRHSFFERFGLFVCLGVSCAGLSFTPALRAATPIPACYGDVIVWDTITIDVRQDAQPGDYYAWARSTGQDGSNVSFVIHLDSNLSYTLSPSLVGYYYGTKYWVVETHYYAPPTSFTIEMPVGQTYQNASVDADSPVELGARTDCNTRQTGPYEEHASVRIRLGSADAPPANTPARPSDSNSEKPDDDNTDCGRCCEGGPMAKYFFHLLLASLHIEDTPISFKPPRGSAIDFQVAYNQRETQPDNFDYTNFGKQWTFNWLSYITDDPSSPYADASVYVRGGGTEVYTGFNSDTQSYAADPQSRAILVRTSFGLAYEKDFPDGSKRNLFGERWLNDQTAAVLPNEYC